MIDAVSLHNSCFSFHSSRKPFSLSLKFYEQSLLADIRETVNVGLLSNPNPCSFLKDREQVTPYKFVIPSA